MFSYFPKYETSRHSFGKPLKRCQMQSMFASSRNTNRAGCPVGGAWWYQQANLNQKSQATRLQLHKSPLTKCTPIKSFAVGTLGRETQTMFRLGALKQFPSAATRTLNFIRDVPKKLRRSLQIFKYSDTLTGPSPKQSDLVRPVLRKVQ